MITDQVLESYHDEALSPAEMRRVSEALRTDPALRGRLARVRHTDLLVRAALTQAPAERPTSRHRMIVPAAVAATLALGALGLWRMMTPPPAQPGPPFVAETHVEPAYQSVRVVLTLPATAPREKTPAMAAPESAVLAESWPVPSSLSKASIHSELSALPLTDQLEACRAWAGDPRVRPFVFAYLRDLGAQEGFADDVAMLAVQMSGSPELQPWVRSYLREAQPRPSSATSESTHTTA